ncbi:hypothetical protein QTN25_000679 [Entamoeba marina]
MIEHNHYLFLILCGVSADDSKLDGNEPTAFYWAMTGGMAAIVIAVLLFAVIIDTVKMKYLDVWKGI